MHEEKMPVSVAAAGGPAIEESDALGAVIYIGVGLGVSSLAGVRHNFVSAVALGAFAGWIASELAPLVLVRARKVIGAARPRSQLTADQTNLEPTRTIHPAAPRSIRADDR